MNDEKYPEAPAIFLAKLLGSFCHPVECSKNNKPCR
jgi:hypothetical protein